MKRKLNDTEKRALRHFENNPDQFTLEIVWTKNSTWGSTAKVVNICGDRLSHIASGCGYCKASAALADTLRFVPMPEESQGRIGSLGGSGMNNVLDNMRVQGWDVEDHETRHSHTIKFTRTTCPHK